MHNFMPTPWGVDTHRLEPINPSVNMADSRVGGEEEERRKPGMADNSEWWSWAMEQESDGETVLSSTEVEFPWEGSDERFAQTQIAVTGVGGHDALFKLVSSRAPARASSTDSPHESSADFGMDHGAARDIAPGVAQEVAHTNIVGRPFLRLL